MIIMINGAFGVGKTTIATALQQKINNSMIYDPEMVGFLLREVIPEDIKRKESHTGDFQDLDLWKEVSVELAQKLVAKYKMNLIVPMTLRKIEYLDYIKSGFEDIDTTHHFCLTANRETIFARLRERGEVEGNWCFQQTDLCLQAFDSGAFGEYIKTDQVSVDAIIDQILEKIR